MAALADPPRRRRFEATAAAVAPALGLAVLVGASAALRLRGLDVGLWTDEGIALGIATGDVAGLPDALRRDGSPPLYYLVLHGWTAVLGTSEVAARSLSVACALLAVPAAWWLGASADRRTAWTSAALAALAPPLTWQAQEVRMYALAALLSIAATRAWVAVARGGGRRWAGALGLALGALLLTHAWAVFLVAGLALGTPLLLGRADDRTVVQRRLTGALALALALWAPWWPVLAAQVGSTGAPWADVPDLADLAALRAWTLLAATITLAVIVAALVRLARGRRGPRFPVVPAAAAFAAALVLAWLAAQVVPNWAERYLLVLAGPLVLGLGGALAHAGRAGVVLLAGLLVVAVLDAPPRPRSNARTVAAALAPALRAGDVVVVGWPEQQPVLAHYLPAVATWRTTLGPVEAPGGFDWRDAEARLRRAPPEREVAGVVRGLPPGRRLVFLAPRIDLPADWTSAWKRLVREHARRWEAALAADPRLRPLSLPVAGDPARRSSLVVRLYERVASRT